MVDSVRKPMFALPSLSLHPEPPEDQPGCIKGKYCDFCDGDVWLSLKKRLILEKHPNIVKFCYDCGMKCPERIFGSKEAFEEALDCMVRI